MARLPRTDAGNPLRAFLKEQRRIQRQQGYASSFTRSGMNVTAEGEISSDDFDGDLANRDAGTTGWGLSGDAAAFGDLILRPRSIGDDALSSLLRGDFMGTTQNNFAVPNSDNKVAVQSLTVPDGFSGALVTNIVNATANNTSVNSDYIYVSSLIESPTVAFNGAVAFTTIPAGSWGSASASGVAMAEGLSTGDQITCSVRVRSGSGWSAQAANAANMNATVIWFR